MCRCDEIQEQCLPGHVLSATERSGASQSPSTNTNSARLPDSVGHKPQYINLRMLSKEEERKLIEATLREAGGRRVAAASRLGIDPSTLWRKMKKLGL